MESFPPSFAAALAAHYRLERELGQGGMATVYLATDVRHQRPVAIKVLHQDLAAALGTERFLKEIQLTAALQHPNILPLFDSGEVAGRVYYVMPFVEGETLRARLDRERQLPVADALRIASEVASALDYAHKRGIVHRDIKPENILLQDGRALVADFGIALAVAEAGGAARLTQTGVSLGTPQYMSPEQAMGERSTDARTDLFALGAVTYEMLSGEPPFSGPTVQAIVAKVLTSAPVPVADLRHSVPAAAADAVMAALEKLPADRPSSAEQFARMLTGEAPAPATRTSGARPHAKTPRTIVQRVMQRVMPWLLGAAAGLALGAALMSWRGRTSSPTASAISGPVRFVVDPRDSVHLVTVCCGRMFAISPDGRTLVYQGAPPIRDSSATAPPLHLYARDLASLQPRLLPGTEGAAALSFSPDGSQLAFVAGQKLMRLSLQGGAATVVTELPAGYMGGTAWRDAQRVLVAVQSTLYEVTMRDGQSRVILPPDSLSQQLTGPTVIAGTENMLFAYARVDQRPVVQYLAAGATTPRALMMGASPIYVPAWKALVINRQGRVLAFPFNPATGDTLGPGVTVADGVTLRSPVLAFAEYDIAPSGTMVTARRSSDAFNGWLPSSQLIMRTGAEGHPVSLPENPLVVYTAQFSPDGRQLAISGEGSKPLGSVFVQDLARGTNQRVSGGDDALFIGWTDRGDSIVYSTRSVTLYIRAADGAGAARMVTPMPHWQHTDGLSVRGRIVAITGAGFGRQVSNDIMLVNLDGREPPRTYLATPAEEIDPAISPDGRWMAYSSSVSGRSEVYVSPMPEPVTRTVVSTGGGRQPVWSADGRTLSFASPDGAFFAVPFASGTAGGPPTLGTPRVLGRYGYARFWTMSPDGTRMLIVNSAALNPLMGLEVVLGYTPAF